MINFPSSPTNGQVHIEGGITWVFVSAKNAWRMATFINVISPIGGGADDTAVINTTLASLTGGGELIFLPGLYKVKRGTGSLLADNIIADNITILGPGAIIESFNAAGVIPNNAGNEFYNVFQATGRKNIHIKDLKFIGYCTALSAFECDGIVTEIKSDGLLANAGGYLRNKTIYVHKCIRVRDNSDLKNFEFGLYLSGDNTTRTRNVVATGTYENNVAAGSFTALFPVGVYAYYANDVVVTGGALFKNIYSSLDSGTIGTGMGYGVYEGDGACNQITVTPDCTFVFDGNGNKNAMGIYANEALVANLAGHFTAAAGGRMVAAIRADVRTAGTQFNFGDVNIANAAITGDGFLVVFQNGVAARITSNGTINIKGGFHAVRIDASTANADADIYMPNLNATAQQGPQTAFTGNVASPIKFPQLLGWRLTRGQVHAILFNEYVISPQISDCMLLDGNLSNAAGDDGAAILQTSVSYGIKLTGCTIGNTAFGGGLFTKGVVNAANAENRIFKDITANNNFIGLANNLQFGSFYTSSPVNGIFDINKGDFIQNAQLGDGSVPGWYCTQLMKPALISNASSASATINADTSNMLAGDIVLLCKDANPYDGDYADTTKWHKDIVLSITDGTNFVLTTGIPAGDGTYIAGTAAIRVARFKAAAAIAA